MRKTACLLLLLPLLSACAGSRRDLRLTSEPSIERAFDVLEVSDSGKPLVKFLYRNPVLFEYSNTAGNCHKFALKKGLIYLPSEMRGSDLVLALTLARAAYIYRLYTLTGMEEIITEEEELSALFQARLALELNAVQADFSKAEGSAAARSSLCTYIMHKSDYTRDQARREALSQNPDCQRPLDTLSGQRTWLAKMRQAVNDDSFARLLYERDLDRVRRGVLTQAEAMKNDARTRALPSYETYRLQRTFYDAQNAIFAGFENIYRQEVKADEAWRGAHQAELDRARREFSDCDMPI